MYNDLLTIGNFTIHGYGLMIGIGVATAMLIGDKRAVKRGMNGDIIYGMTIAAVVFGFLAAKVLFIITKLPEFLEDPVRFITGSGFVVFGGLFGGILTVHVYCKLCKVDTLTYIDLMAPSVAIAQGFGRIGCLLAGCCYGRETDSIFGIVFRNSDYAPNNVRLIPTQIIMSVGDFVIAGILLYLARKPRRKGDISCIWLILYSVGRFAVEFLRNDYRGSVGILSTSQFIGIITVVIALLTYIFLLPIINKKQD